MPWVAGNSGVISWMNTIDTERGAWTAYTPTFTQGAGVAITANSTRYNIDGKRITVHYSFIINGAGTATAAMSVTLPAAALNASALLGCGTIFYQDSAPATLYVLQPASTLTTAFTMLSIPGGTFGNNAAVTAAAGDIINGTLIYEGA